MKAEILLRCARKACPLFEWSKSEWVDSMVINNYGGTFRLSNPADQMTLQIALEDHKNGGWSFWRTEDGTFVAESWDEAAILFAKTKSELLAQCVEHEEVVA